MVLIKKFFSIICIYSLLSLDIYAVGELAKNYKVKDLILPSETTNIAKKGGSVFFSPHAKGKVLMPVNIWGEVKQSGLHFVPTETTLLKGISMAGGPSSSAKLGHIRLMREGQDKSLQDYKFNLKKGGTKENLNFALKPGDTIFVEKSSYIANRSYYTSLFGVLATVLSTVLLFREVKK